MSADLVATLSKPVTLAAVIDDARRILSELLAINDVPDLIVFSHREFPRTRNSPGRRLDIAELETTEVGGPAETGLGGAVFFTIGLRATGDGVTMMVVDHRRLTESNRSASFTPSKTCVGVTVATGLALATATVAEGEYVDQEIFMLKPPVYDPAEVITRTRLAEPSHDFAAQCERYLHQFPDLQGWPRRVSSA